MSICLLHVPRCIPACARSHLYAHNGQCADLHCPERAQNAHPMRVRERAAAGDGCQRCHRTVHRCRAPRQRPHPRENLAPVYIFGSRLGPPHETASRALVHQLWSSPCSFHTLSSCCWPSCLERWLSCIPQLYLNWRTRTSAEAHRFLTVHHHGGRRVGPQLDPMQVGNAQPLELFHDHMQARGRRLGAGEPGGGGGGRNVREGGEGGERE